MAKAYVLSESDKVAIQRVIDDVRRMQVPARSNVEYLDDDGQSPQLYVAKTPTAGIMPLAHGDCEIYQMVPSPETEETGTGTTDEMRFGEIQLEDTYTSQPVYNISALPVLGIQWIVVARDAYGQWVIVRAKNGEAMVVKILSGPDSSERYTAWAEEWSEEHESWLIHYSILAREMNGREPVIGERYVGVFADQSEEDVPIYEIRPDCPCAGAGEDTGTGTGSGGGGGDIVFTECCPDGMPGQFDLRLNLDPTGSPDSWFTGTKDLTMTYVVGQWPFGGWASAVFLIQQTSAATTFNLCSAGTVYYARLAIYCTMFQGAPFWTATLVFNRLGSLADVFTPDHSVQTWTRAISHDSNIVNCTPAIQVIQDGWSIDYYVRCDGFKVGASLVPSQKFDLTLL